MAIVEYFNTSNLPREELYEREITTPRTRLVNGVIKKLGIFTYINYCKTRSLVPFNQADVSSIKEYWYAKNHFDELTEEEKYYVVNSIIENFETHDTYLRCLPRRNYNLPKKDRINHKNEVTKSIQRTTGILTIGGALTTSLTTAVVYSDIIADTLCNTVLNTSSIIGLLASTTATLWYVTEGRKTITKEQENISHNIMDEIAIKIREMYPEYATKHSYQR